MTLFFLLEILIYNLIVFSLVTKKNKSIFDKQRIFTNSRIKTNSNNIIINLVKKKEELLKKLDFPYKLTIKKYIFIKYFFSIIIFIFAIINYKNFKIPTTLFLISFFLPNYLIYSFKKKENIMLISEIKNLTSNLILIFSSNVPIRDMFSLSLISLKTTRFKKEYEHFIYNYEHNGYSLKNALKRLESKFDSYELSLFINTILDLEKQGNIKEGLEKFLQTIELSYFKYLKRKQENRLLYVVFGTVLILINITLIIMYPIFMQVINNLGIIFT